MNVAITGYSGFVGQNLTSYLEDKGLKYSEWNLRADEFSLADIDAVIHLAGKAHDLKGNKSLQDYLEVNLELTKRVFEKFLKSNAHTFIFISSVKAVADKLDVVLTEETLANPLTAYGISKLKAEEYLLGYKLPDTKRLIILRPCMIHGPNNKGNLNLLHKFVKLGLPWPLTRFTNKRSFLSVGNLCYAIHNLLLSDIKGVFNIADTVPISVNELVDLIAKEMGKSPLKLRIHPTAIQYIAKLGDIFKLPFNSHRLDKLTENYVVDNSKLLEELKISKLPYSTEEGLLYTIKSFKRNA